MSNNLQVKSVSTADDEANKCILIGPVISIGLVKVSVWKLKISCLVFKGS